MRPIMIDGNYQPEKTWGDTREYVTGLIDLKFRDPLTQSGVWYRLRPDMIVGGYEPEQNWGETRRYITSKINQVCKELTDEEGTC